MHVAELWRFPVKSMQGSRADTLTIDATGVARDRGWGVVDPAAGRVLSAKRWPDLLLAAATIDDDTGVVTITLPDGTEHECGDPNTDDAVSSWLEHPVVMRRADDAEALPFEMYADPADDASPTFEFTGPAGRWVDLAHAHLLTTASLRAAAALHPDGEWDVRRFRPLALVDADGDDFVEDAWIGQEVHLGAVTVTPFMPTVRCSLPTRAQPGLARDAKIATTLHRHHGLNLGVYGNIAAPGVVAVGDPVNVGSPGGPS
jgi:uncharacterized protein YcbX